MNAISLAIERVDTWIYFAIGVILLAGAWLCLLPLLRVRSKLQSALRRLDRREKDGSYAYESPNFLNCRCLDHSWRCFLENLRQMRRSNGSCDVADFINAQSAIQEPGHCALGRMIPGVLTTLGILGTFCGIVEGLSGMDLSDSQTMSQSIATLIVGMQTAFNTSIVGAVGALAFQLTHRLFVSMAEKALGQFARSCQTMISVPLSAETQILRAIQTLLGEVRRTNELLSDGRTNK